jgi:putative ABC transport system substrate-binding protein
VVARAQQGDRVRRIGMLMSGDENDPEEKLRLSAFTKALADLGWTDGRNVRMDLRSTATTVALQRETRTIPIVFANVADPVASGIVSRLDRPSGNITGFATMEASLGGKWLELLSEITPGLKRAAIMFNPDTAPVSAYMPPFETAARSLKVEPIIATVHSDGEIETAIIALGREPGSALVVMPDAFMVAHRAPIISAAARNNVPAGRMIDLRNIRSPIVVFCSKGDNVTPPWRHRSDSGRQRPSCPPSPTTVTVASVASEGPGAAVGSLNSMSMESGRTIMRVT